MGINMNKGSTKKPKIPQYKDILKLIEKKDSQELSKIKFVKEPLHESDKDTQDSLLYILAKKELLNLVDKNLLTRDMLALSNKWKTTVLHEIAQRGSLNLIA